MLNSLRAGAAACLFALSLGGCATLDQFGATVAQDASNVYAVVTGASVSPQAVVVAANSFDALQATAVNYLRLPLCTATSGPICRVKAATIPLKNAILAGRTARANLEAFAVAHPGQLGPSGLYDAVTAAVNTLGAIATQYNIGAAVAAVSK